MHLVYLINTYYVKQMHCVLAQPGQKFNGPNTEKIL